MTLTADIYRSDAIEWLKTLPDASVDLICTDPAYDELTRHRKVGTTTRLTGGKGAKGSESVEDGFFQTVPDSYYWPLCEQFRRVLKPHGALVHFGGWYTTGHVLVPALKFAGFPARGKGTETYQRLACWDKMTLGMGWGLRRGAEWVLIQHVGRHKRKWKDNPDYDRSMCDVLREKAIRNGYPTEKPVDVMRALIRQFSHPGDLVIDPFLGSGSVAVAARAEHRNFAGCDIDQGAVEHALARLTQQEQQELWKN